MIQKIFKIFNNLSIWRIPIKIDGVFFTPISFDRMAALLVHKFFPAANSFTEWIAQNGHAGAVVLDIGANQGLFAIAASKIVGPSGVVHAFEPDKKLAGCLKNNLIKNGIQNVKVHEFALGASPGVLNLYKNPYNSGDNRLTKDINHQASSSITVKPVDDLSEIQKIDFVKIDVQGWELSVLKGMIAKLRLNPQAKILFEFWPYGMRIGGFDSLHLISFMIDNQYALKENGSSKVILRDNACEFIKRITGKKYTDIEAVKIA